MTGSFLRVRCRDCQNEQLIFSNADLEVLCSVCGTVLASPTGGRSKFRGKVTEELE